MARPLHHTAAEERAHIRMKIPTALLITILSLTAGRAAAQSHDGATDGPSDAARPTDGRVADGGTDVRVGNHDAGVPHDGATDGSHGGRRTMPHRRPSRRSSSTRAPAAPSVAERAAGRRCCRWACWRSPWSGAGGAVNPERPARRGRPLASSPDARRWRVRPDGARPADAGDPSSPGKSRPHSRGGRGHAAAAPERRARRSPRTHSNLSRAS